MVEEVLTRVANELGLKKRLVKEAYMFFWKYIHDDFSSNHCKEVGIDDYESIRTGYRIPFIGILYIPENLFKTQKQGWNDRLEKQ